VPQAQDAVTMSFLSNAKGGLTIIGVQSKWPADEEADRSTVEVGPGPKYTAN
jgi:hypothetical protein